MQQHRHRTRTFCTLVALSAILSGFPLTARAKTAAADFIPALTAPDTASDTAAPEVAGPPQQTADSHHIPIPRHKPSFAAPAPAQPPYMPPLPANNPAHAAQATIGPRNASLYRRIMTIQATGDIKKADSLLAQVTDDRLRGPILYQRYIHPTAYKPNFAELQDWMKRYADQPGADRVYKLALARMPAGFDGALAKPAINDDWAGRTMAILSDQPVPYHPRKARTPSQESAFIALKKTIRLAIRRGQPTEALHQLKRADPKLMETVEYDQLRGEIAKGYMSAGKMNEAMELSLASIERSAENAPDAGWIGGLVAWRQADYPTAARLFGTVANSPYASSWMEAGGAYWASRAFMRAGEMEKVRPMLEKAAAHPRTFYGLLATRALGWDFDFDWSVPLYTAAHKNLLSRLPAFQRATALNEIGQTHMAEEELLTINPGADPALREALVAYASHTGLPALAMKLARAFPRPARNGKPPGLYDAALYPMPPWKPEGGYRIDTSLLLALIRQESCFDPDAESASGAVGLMQLMPGTATFVSGETYEETLKGRFALKDPKVNLDIGQRYVENLLYTDSVGADLMSMLIAYNAGPGNLAHWKQQYADTASDPLLFIETIPMAETRAYVERVMSNYWIYRLRQGQPSATLDAVAYGQGAPYVKPLKQARADDVKADDKLTTVASAR
jgi:soluble lytic murein transglycosylase-like protein